MARGSRLGSVPWPIVSTLGSLVVGAASRFGREPLSFGRYLLGWLVILGVGGALVAAAVAARRAVVGWTGAPARLVEAVVALAIVTGTSFVLGGLHAFSGWPLALGLIGVSIAVRGLAHRAGPAVRPLSSDEARRSRFVERWVAVAALAIVGAQWISHTAWALGHGMTEGDTLWYHGVFASRFIQVGRLDIFPDIGASAQGFFPANSQMYHALAFFPFDRDLLSPTLNLVFAALAVLAAYCIGRRRGLGALCVTASAVVMGLPAVVGTHPGQGTNDFLCATFLLVAIALIVEGGVQPVPLALAGVAAALSVGTKLTVAFPLAVLTVAIIGIAVRRRNGRLIIAWLVPLAAFGAFWFLRNWLRADNPLPWYDLHLGPLHLPIRSRLADNASIADHLFERDVWDRIWRPGLHQAFGSAWPVLIAAPAVAALAMVGRGRRSGERVAGAVTIAAGIGYVVMPFTMELGGAAFAATARYASPALLLGLVMVPIALRIDRRGLLVRSAISFAALVVIVMNAVAPNVDRFAPWRYPDRFLAVVIVAVVIAGIGFGRIGGRPARYLLVAPVLLVLVVGGFFVQRDFSTHRYAVGAGLRLDHIDEYLSGHRPGRVVPFATIQFYPFLGPSFANDVVVLEPPPASGNGNGAVVRCHKWERALRRADPRYVIDGGEFVPVERPDASWFRTPGLHRVAHTRRATLYEVRGPIRLTCPPA